MNRILLSMVLPALLSAMSIKEVVQKSIETHPKIKIKKEELYVEKELLTTAKSGYLPTIDLSYSVGPEITKTIANSRERVDETRQEASGVLTQNLFAGFDTENRVEQQKSLILSASDSVKDSANSLALEAVGVYVDLLCSKELLNIAAENVGVHKKYLKQIKEKVDAGVGRSSDYKQTLSRYENAQSTFLLTELNYKNAISSYQRVLPGAVSAEDLEKPTLGALPASDLESLIALSMKNNPTVRVSKDNVAVARYSLKRSDAAYYPKADIVAKATWDRNLYGISVDKNVPSQYLENIGLNAMLVISYNLFNGLSDEANKEVNRHKLLKENATLEDSKRFIEASVKLAWQTYLSSEKQLIHIDKNIAASADTVADYKEENDLGRRSIIDLLNIELEYNAARNRKVTAEYSRLIAYYKILAYSGAMLESMDIGIE